MSKIHVALVDDHEVVRLGLKLALESHADIEVVASFADAAVAVSRLEAIDPDIVLMDVRIPGMDGITACRLLRARLPNVKVLMLTSYGEEQAVFASIMAGASGYLLKNTGAAELVSAVRAVARGESLLDPGVTAKVLARLRDLSAKQEAHELQQLSAREVEVLTLVAQGLTNKEISTKLVISEHTARNHISRILDKLGLTRRSEAAVYAAEHGLTRPRTD